MFGVLVAGSLVMVMEMEQRVFPGFTTNHFLLRHPVFVLLKF